MSNFNLQIRLGILLTVFFLLGTFLILMRAVVVSDSQVRDEVESVSGLINRMFSIVELGSESPFNPDTEPAFLSELVALENIRHIDIRIQSETADYPQVNADSSQTVDAPAWFVALVYPKNDIEIRRFIQSNGDVIAIFADPGDEIEEIWRATRSRVIATFIFLLVIVSLVFYFTRRWMQPADAIVDVLDSVDQGDFSRRIPDASLPELNRIVRHINSMTTHLGYSKSENERLIRKSITVQEEERQHLAQELHDSLGQAVSAIKAIAMAIAERSRERDPNSAGQAENIEEIAESAYQSVRNLMTSLRPSILDELGLVEALKQMVDDWNVHHEDTFCRLKIEGDYDSLLDEQTINVYRIVQESLTNISKYAQAENVSITLSGKEIVTLMIIDDGVGFTPGETSRNMGLSGIRDRVTLLQGELEISSKPGKGVSIQIEFPRIDHFRRRSSDK